MAICFSDFQIFNKTIQSVLKQRLKSEWNKHLFSDMYTDAHHTCAYMLKCTYTWIQKIQSTDGDRQRL